jgi:hypothetical protein
MSGKIEISRETLENSLKDGSSDPAVYASYRKAVADIRALLAAPVVERQEPVGEVLDMKYNCVKFYRATGDTSKPYLLPGTKLYTSPPAPVEVVLPSREAMRDIIAEAIGGDTYDCTRVWSAWGIGTMSEDDFVPITLDEERLYEIADACIDKVKELNQ